MTSIRLSIVRKITVAFRTAKVAARRAFADRLRIYASWLDLWQNGDQARQRGGGPILANASGHQSIQSLGAKGDFKKPHDAKVLLASLARARSIG